MLCLKSIITKLRSTLQPQGTAPLVRLFLSKDAYFDVEFVNACIDQVEKIHVGIVLEGEISTLEKLAIQVLLDSAYINLKGEKDDTRTSKENGRD